MHACLLIPCSAHLIFIDLLFLILLGEECASLSSRFLIFSVFLLLNHSWSKMFSSALCSHTQMDVNGSKIRRKRPEEKIFPEP
jgi:hypothetical protein